MDLRITHAERVIDKESGTTKGDLVAFYDQVVGADAAAPARAGRCRWCARPRAWAASCSSRSMRSQSEMPGVKLLDPALDPDHEPLLQIDTAPRACSRPRR